jgi:hypothetical protein
MNEKTLIDAALANGGYETPELNDKVRIGVKRSELWGEMMLAGLMEGMGSVGTNAIKLTRARASNMDAPY